MVLIDVLI